MDIFNIDSEHVRRVVEGEDSVRVYFRARPDSVAIANFLKADVRKFSKKYCGGGGDFGAALEQFNDLLEDLGINRITEESTPRTYSYLQAAYLRAEDEWEDANSALFSPTTYPEVYPGTDYRGSNILYYDVAKAAMESWILAMLLAELVPSEATGAETTNNQTELYRFAYNDVDPDGDGKKIPLYGGFEIHSDPMIARLAAAGIYAKVRHGKTFAQIEEMRKEIYGDNNDHWIPASDWSGLGYTHTEGKNANDERIGYTMNTLGYLINTSLFLPSSPGPRVAGCLVDSQPLPKDQGQPSALFISDNNYDVDDKINTFMVDNYKMMAQTPLSTWNGYSPEKKERLVQVMATARCSYMFMFGSPIDISMVLDNGQLPVVDGYNRYEFEESATPTGLKIDGPFSDLAGIYRYDIPAQDKSLQEVFLETVAEIADDCRYPTFDPNFGRRRPGCGNTITASELNPIHGSDENELYNVDISCMVADTAAQKAAWAAEDGFAADRPNSYPSGHTAQVWTHAMMLGQMDPTRLTVWMRKAYEFSVNRSIGRAHWNSDLIYGRLFATMIIPIINAMNGIQTGYDATKATVGGGGGGTNPVISINITIVNNSGSLVTLDGDLKFTLGNPDHNGNYLGWNGPYNGTDHIGFSSSQVTLAAGESRTFNGLTWRDADTGCGLGDKSPANAEQLAAAGRPRNVLLYVGGESTVVLPENMDPTIIFEEGHTYTVTIPVQS